MVKLESEITNFGLKMTMKAVYFEFWIHYQLKRKTSTLYPTDIFFRAKKATDFRSSIFHILREADGLGNLRGHPHYTIYIGAKTISAPSLFTVYFFPSFLSIEIDTLASANYRCIFESTGLCREAG